MPDFEVGVTSFISARIAKMYTTGLGCDVILVIGKMRILAHRIVLGSASEYLCDMIYKKYRELLPGVVEFELLGCDDYSVFTLVNYMYNGELYPGEKDIEKLMDTANLLQLTEAMKICFEFLICKCNITNWNPIYQISKKFGNKKLKKHCLDTVLANFEESTKLEGWLLACSADVQAVITNNNINQPTAERIFTALVKWLEYAPKKRSYAFAVLFSHVKLSMLSVEFIKNEVMMNPVIRENSRCLCQIIEKSLISNVIVAKSKRRLTENPSIKHEPYISGVSKNDRIEKFDLISETWQEFDTKQLEFTPLFVTGLLNGDIFISGEISFQCFNAVSDEFKYSGVYPSQSDCPFFEVIVWGDDLYLSGRRNNGRLERYALKDKSWNETSPMFSQRSFFGVAVFEDRIFVIGGESGKTCLTDVECYSPALDKWTQCSPMSVPRCKIGVGVFDGYIYAAGGTDSNSAALRVVERYNPNLDSWELLTPLTIPRSFLAVGYMGDNMLAIGGLDQGKWTTTVEMYDPERRKWSEEGSLTEILKYPSVLP